MIIRIGSCLCCFSISWYGQYFPVVSVQLFRDIDDLPDMIRIMVHLPLNGYENSFAFPECRGFIQHCRENILSIFAERVRNVRDNVRSFIRSFRFFRFFSPNAIVASRPMSPWPAIIARCREQERIRASLHSLLARPKKGEKSS